MMSLNCKVLIIDDVPENIDILYNILKQKYELYITKTGKAALELLKKELPDIILLDIMMPDMDGFEVCKRLKANEKTKDIPIIFLTGKTDTDDIIQGLLLGAVDYVIKPYNPIELETRIKNHLELYQAKKIIENHNLILEEKVNQRTKELHKTVKDLEKSLSEKDVLIKEVHHRVKNNLQFLSAIFLLQFDKIKDKKILHMLKVYNNRLRSLAIVHNELYDTNDFTNIDLVGFINRQSVNLFSFYKKDNNKIKITINTDNFIIDINYAIPCSLILNELLSNSISHAFGDDEEGIIAINLKYNEHDEMYTIIVQDNGCGLNNGITFENAQTFGFKLLQILTAQLNGKIIFENGNGTKVTIMFNKLDLKTYHKIDFK